MALRWYKHFIDVFPELSRIITSVSLGAAGDIVAQKVIEKKRWDPIRTLRFSCLGIVLAPAIHRWFCFLESRFSSTGLGVLKKVALDQAVAAPVCNTFVLLTLEALQGRSYEEMMVHYRTTFPILLMSNYKVWPAVQLINFYFVPLAYKILYVSAVAFFWNTYVAYTVQGAGRSRHKAAVN